jgi:signal transduction histidine kinase
MTAAKALSAKPVARLALTQRIIRRLGGRIWAESVRWPGGGVLFHVE